jgi:hypothetical protein
MANVRFEFNGKLADGRFWDESSTKRVTVELDDNDLTVDEMLEEFMNFMQAIGYKFELGDRFEVVNDFKQPKQNNLQDQPIIDESGSLIGMAHGTSHPGYGAVPPSSDAGGVVLPPDTAS